MSDSKKKGNNNDNLINNESTSVDNSEMSINNIDSDVKKELSEEISDNAIEELLILKQTIEEKNELIEKIKNENEENKDLLIRLKADFENYKKRVREEQKEMIKFSNIKLISDLLPVLDDFDRAISSISDEFKNSSIFEGLNMVIKSFHNILEKKYYLEKINEENVPFDPHFHEAISVIEDKTIKGMYVEKVLQAGYKIDSRILRSAKVVVKKGLDNNKNSDENKSESNNDLQDKSIDESINKDKNLNDTGENLQNK